MATPRETFQLFGSGGPTTYFAQFGSQAASAPLKTKSIPTIQSLSAWLNGLQAAVSGGNNAPYLEDINALFYVLAYEIYYMLERGIPEWDSATTYDAGSFVQAGSGSGLTGAMYFSITNSNLNNPLPTFPNNNAFWALGPYIHAANIVDQILGTQIASVPAGIITGTIADSQISGMSASKLIGLIIAAQIQSVSAAAITGLVVDAQIQSLSTSKLTGPIPVTPGSVHAAGLSTATGNVSGGGGPVVNVTMNDYNFFPNLQGQGGADEIIEFATADTGDTIGRFGKGGAYAYNFRWRYVASSDNPRIWLVVDKAGKIYHAWESEDPPNHADILEFGEPEICPFTANFGEDYDIVPAPIPTGQENLILLDRLTPATQVAAVGRRNRMFNFKGWDKGIKSNQQVMADHLLFRAMAGRGNPARMIRQIFSYSHIDKRLIASKDAHEQIGPDGLIPKETK